MTAPVFLLDPALLAEAKVGSTFSFGGSEAHHAASVVRVRPGELIELVDGEGQRVHAIVEAGASPRDGQSRGSSAERAEVRVRVERVIHEAVPRPRFVVAQALAKGEHGELAVDLMTQVGVDVIIPWAAQRCVTQWRADRADRGRRKWVDASIQASKQARRARVPQIAPLASLEELVEVTRAAACTLVLHEQAMTDLAAVALPEDGDVLMVIGPEGGLADDERLSLKEAGSQEVRLGPTVLRTSLAGATAITALSARSRWRASAMGG
jgi:16S rRNA (uracil1498-N3)-methyltransferase